jgi:thiol:disulfide interchange protein
LIVTMRCPAPSRLAAALLIALCATPATAGTPGHAPDARRAPGSTQAGVWVKLAPAAGPLAAQIAAQVEAAKAKHLAAYVYLGAKWCEPCVLLAKYREDPKMRDAFTGTYIIELDMDQWKEKDMRALGYKLGEIPYFSELDARGHGTGREITGGAWGENIPENMAPPLKRFFAKR